MGNLMDEKKTLLVSLDEGDECIKKIFIGITYWTLFEPSRYYAIYDISKSKKWDYKYHWS